MNLKIIFAHSLYVYTVLKCAMFPVLGLVSLAKMLQAEVTKTHSATT